MNRKFKLLLFAILVFTLCIATVSLSACVVPDNSDKSKLAVSFDNTHTVYEGDTLDSLKPYLTVTYTDKDGNTSTVTEYTLIGNLTKGDCTVTVKYNNLTATCKITVQEKKQDNPDPQPETYTVTFKADGETVDTQTYTAQDTNITEPAVPTKTGYTGVWESYSLTTGNITVNAVYTAKQYTVNLDYDGATSGNAQHNITVTYNQTISNLPTPEKMEYNFAGWYYGSTLVTSNTVWVYDDESAELTAKWSIDEFTVTFKADGKTVAVKTYTVENKNITEPEVPDKIGYTGIWEQYTLTTGNVTVNAVYTPVTYAVTFKADNGVVDTLTYTVENKNITEPDVPCKTGYTGVWESYSLKTGNITVNAVYTAKQYTVTFDYDGATENNTQQTITVTYDKTIGALPEPTKDGYAFAGWIYNENIVTSTTVWIFDVTSATFTAQWEKVLAGTAGLNYQVNNDEITCSVTGIGTATDTDIVIPSTYEGKSVTSIGDGAFYDCNSLTSITIPDSVTSIGSDAFYGCSSLANINYLGTIDDWCKIKGLDHLMSRSHYYISNNTFSLNGQAVTELVIPNTVTSIPSYAFYGTNITSVTIPDSVTSIGSYAFDGCNSLANINYLGTIDDWCKIKGLYYLMYNNTINKTLVIDGKEITGELVIPNTITAISSGAFYGTNIISVTIPDSVTSIGDSAFRLCSSLTSVTIPDSVTSIGDEAFYRCNSLANINYLGTIDDWCKIDELNHLMYYSTSNKTLVIDGKEITGELVIPNTITAIPSSAFYNTNITSVTFEENSQCTSIGDFAFHDCNNLTSITIPDSVTLIGSYVFSDCSSLTSVTIPDSVTSISICVFLNCEALTIYCEATCNASGWTEDWNKLNNIIDNTIYIPVVWDCKNNKIATDGYMYAVIYGIRYSLKDNVATVVKQPVNITIAIIPDSVTYEGTNYSVTSIGEHAFRGCSELTSVTIPDSVTSIGSSAFDGCSSLTSVTIPSGVTSIGSDAFNYCINLANINYLGTIADWCKIEGLDNLMYYGTNSKTFILNGVPVTELVIPNTVTSIPDHAFEKTNITSIIISDSVTNIGDEAFMNCSKLANINYLGTVEDWCKIEGIIYLLGGIIEEGNNYRLLFNGKELTGELIIPNTVTSITSTAFAYTNIASVTFEENSQCTNIGSYAFFGCSNITNVIIPDSVTSIGESAFYGCDKLAEIQFTGTVAQWNAITKGDYWKSGVPAKKVICSDGEVAL